MSLSPAKYTLLKCSSCGTDGSEKEGAAYHNRFATTEESRRSNFVGEIPLAVEQMRRGAFGGAVHEATDDLDW